MHNCVITTHIALSTQLIISPPLPSIPPSLSSVIKTFLSYPHLPLPLSPLTLSLSVP